MATVSNNFQGVRDDLTNERYHKIEALGSSSIKRASQTLAHFKAYMDGKLAPSSALQSRFDLGTCAHSVILEQSLDSILEVTGEFKTKDGKPAANIKATSEYKQLVKDNPDKILLMPDEYAGLKEMFEVFCEHSIAEKLVTFSEIEKSIFHVDEESGLWLKARPDGMGESYLIDYKTCASVDKNDFEKMIGRAGYDISMAHYKALVEAQTERKIQDVFFVVQEVKAPYAVRVFRLADADLVAAEAKRRELLNKISVAYKDNEFPGYSAEVVEVGARRFTEVETDLFEEAI